jgi:hypothetical protein
MSCPSSWTMLLVPLIVIGVSEYGYDTSYE